IAASIIGMASRRALYIVSSVRDIPCVRLTRENPSLPRAVCTAAVTAPLFLFLLEILMVIPPF
ncbi:MAG: hypothetical protein IIX73_00730, partial [Clostridia bacterium]|nr:hypothetical protein [Clostridia bacterium]